MARHEIAPRACCASANDILLALSDSVRCMMAMSPGPVSRFIDRHYQHFNAAALKDAADAYAAHVDAGGQMLLTLAGAMSTAELGLSLAEMIRREKVHAIVCTGANLEEDLFNLVAHNDYERIPNYRDLTAADDAALLHRNMNRVTDTCIPEHEAMRRIEAVVLEGWLLADRRGEQRFPHEFLWRALEQPALMEQVQIDPADSWLLAAKLAGIPIFCPGWEDSTLGNMYAAHCLRQEIRHVHTVRTGIEAMIELAGWYTQVSSSQPIGFFQIGGGIAGDFPICVVPMLRQDLQRQEVPLWSYFCQISEATTSYGGYSGAVPNEKISWGKLAEHTPKFMIESDATIVAPLIFAKVLNW